MNSTVEIGRPNSRFAIHRVQAMVLRQMYLLRSSWPRVIELIYWPTVQMLTWGFVQLYVSQNSTYFAKASGMFIGALLLWDVLLRGQQGFTFAFLEEMWSRNLGNILMSPLTTTELLISLMVMSLIRLSIGMIPVTLIAIPLFGFNIWGIGLPLALFFANLLIFGWAVGIVVAGLLLRYGMGAESLAWSLMFLILPLTCVYYPVSTLPAFLQTLAWALPTTYVFEGMRAIVIEQTFHLDLMLESLALNALSISAAMFAFNRLLDAARRNGSLLNTGE
jgi:ABC-2 type transport system permease protein